MHVSMKFEDMNETQRAKWLAWANSHDWGARAKSLPNLFSTKR